MEDIKLLQSGKDRAVSIAKRAALPFPDGRFERGLLYGIQYKCKFKKSGFQHREDGMKLGNEERSVVAAFVSTGSSG